MIYPYECTCCGKGFEVIKSVREIDIAELCMFCNAPAKRVIANRGSFYGAGGWDSSYNRGLGMNIKSRSHLKRIIKERGLTEVGNERPDTINKYFDTNRTKRIAQRYKDATEGALRMAGEMGESIG